MVRVLFADNHAIVRKGIGQILASDPGIQVLGAASGFSEAIYEALQSRPDVLVVDVDMPPPDGLSASDLASQITSSGAKVLGMSLLNDDDARSFATSIGAAALVDKLKLATELIPAIMKAASARNYFPPSVAAKPGDGSSL